LPRLCRKAKSETGEESNALQSGGPKRKKRDHAKTGGRFKSLPALGDKKSPEAQIRDRNENGGGRVEEPLSISIR